MLYVCLHSIKYIFDHLQNHFFDPMNYLGQHFMVSKYLESFFLLLTSLFHCGTEIRPYLIFSSFKFVEVCFIAQYMVSFGTWKERMFGCCCWLMMLLVDDLTEPLFCSINYLENGAKVPSCNWTCLYLILVW